VPLSVLLFLPILNNGANKVEKMSSSKKGGKE